MRDVSDRVDPNAGDEQRRGELGRRPGFDLDLALARLEDVLLGAPFDRALPDLHDLLEAADVPVQLLQQDDRVLKLLHEAVVARPFGELEAVRAARTEVELLTLEVEVLTARLLEAPDGSSFDQVTARLHEVRARLEAIRREL